jgi:hypothetical protein
MSFIPRAIIRSKRPGGADTTAPIPSGANHVETATPTIVQVPFNEALVTNGIVAADCTVTGHTVSSVAIVGSELQITVSAAFVNGEAARTVSVAANKLKDAAGNLCAAITTAAITNNVASGFAMTGSGSANATSIASVTVAAGETVIVGISIQGGASPGSISDGTNTYTLIASSASVASVAGALFKADNVTAGTYTITSAGSSTTTGIAYWRYTGLTAGAVQASATGNMNTGGSTAADTLTVGNITPTSAPALIFGFAADQANHPATIGTGYTARACANIITQAGFAEDKRVVTTSAVAGTFTPDPAGNFDAYGMVFCSIGCV